MILINEDKNYLSALDLKAIENGVATLGVHSLRISNFYTEAEKREKRRTLEILTDAENEIRIKTAKRECSLKIESLLDVLDNIYSVYQYKNSSIKYGEHDLFFWCTTAGESRDMSYVTLNTNGKHSNEKQLETINGVLDALQRIEVEGIQIVIQYDVNYNNKRVQEIALDYCKKMKDKFIVYGGWNGKIVEFNGRYVFRKKFARKKAYEINTQTILANVLNCH